MATTTAARLTAEEYFVAAAGDPRPTQLIDGVIVPSQPKFRHQDITGLIYMRLRTWVESDDGFGVAGIPIDVIVDHYNVYAADVWWLADPERIDPDEYFSGVPDLAVEVRSPSTWRYDIGRKKRRYEQHALPELWLVDTDGDVVLVYRRSSGRAGEFDVELELARPDVVTAPQLPGFELAVAEILR
jgi:Uma2 family endonuclease